MILQNHGSMRSESLLDAGDHPSPPASGIVEIVPANDAVLNKPLACFGHFLFLFFRLQKLTWIAHRHRPREAVHMFDSIEHPFDGHTQRRLVDHTQDEMTLEYFPKALGA